MSLDLTMRKLRNPEMHTSVFLEVMDYTIPENINLEMRIEFIETKKCCNSEIQKSTFQASL